MIVELCSEFKNSDDLMIVILFRPFGLLAPKSFKNYLAFQPFAFECT